ncbi:MAG: synthase delta subunit [Acidimicrobiaceae bacterium]|nr:synthase delta subunit [Acidimicrobiaceae bacterium]
MDQLLAGYADAVEESATAAGHLAAVHGALAAMAQALVLHDELRRVLTDPGIDESTRRAVIYDLLEGKATPEAAELLGFAVRVTRATELPLAIAQLLVQLEVVAPGAPEVAPLAGRRASRARLRGYAERVLQELAAIGEVDQLEDECFQLSRLLDEQPDLRAVLSDVAVPGRARADVLADLLTGQVHTATLRLARYAISSGSSRDLVGTFEQLAALAAAERGRRLAEVRSAVDLEPVERDRLASALGRLVERPVEIRVVHDPSVLGGARVSVGDLVIDGTVRLRLERLRDALAQSS